MAESLCYLNEGAVSFGHGETVGFILVFIRYFQEFPIGPRRCFLLLQAQPIVFHWFHKVFPCRFACARLGVQQHDGFRREATVGISFVFARVLVKSDITSDWQRSMTGSIEFLLVL